MEVVYLSGLCPLGRWEGEIRQVRTRNRVPGGLVRVYLSGLCPLGRWEGEIRQVLTRTRVPGGLAHVPYLSGLCPLGRCEGEIRQERTREREYLLRSKLSTLPSNNKILYLLINGPKYFYFGINN
jgi:hypothetical protein